MRLISAVSGVQVPAPAPFLPSWKRGPLPHFLAQRVARTIRQHALAGASDVVAIALSGGPDSVALAWLLHDLSAAPHGTFTIAGLIHVNHGLRGDDAARDEAFCRALALRFG